LANLITKGASLTADQNVEHLQSTAPSEEKQEKEISIDEVLSESSDEAEDASLTLEGNKEQLNFTSSSEETPEKEISFDETFSENSDEAEDASLTLEGNKEQLHITSSPEELQEKEIFMYKESFGISENQEGKPPSTFSPPSEIHPIQRDSELISNPPLPFTVNSIKKPEKSPEASMISELSKKMIAVGGAKGGVGKSMLSANLAVGLALLGQKVVLADLDLGGADVHLYTGVKSLAKTWNDFLDKKVDSVKDILTPTAFNGLSMIGGDSSRLGSANLPYLQKLKIIRHLKALKTDFLIVDLGGDTAYNALDFFLEADQKIVVSGTEPASVLDSYAFVKVAFNRFLERFFSRHRLLKDMAEAIRDGSLQKTKKYSLDFIFQEVSIRDPQALVELKNEFNQFRLSIVLNMTESSSDVRIAESMKNLIKDKCFLDIGILGTIPFDKVVRRAARRFTPIVVENPKCKVSQKIHQMLAAIIFFSLQEKTRAELLHSTRQIRREVKKQIDSGKMTLDGLTIGQINSIFNNTPRLRQSFQKILNIISG
jgi:flagellar biosynthesis protein FlhG